MVMIKKTLAYQSAALSDALPCYLVIVLKRFAFLNGVRSIKIQHFIHFEEVLDMSTYIKSPGFVASSVTRQVLYRLSTVIVHDGPDSYSGHYFSYVRYGSVWYKCNDDSVSVVPIGEGTAR
jgi:ubiquitin C-terminal hydrolase